MKENRKKLLERILALFLVILIGINPVVVPVVWAEGEDGSTGSLQAAEEQVQEESSETPAEPPAESQSEPEPASQGETSAGGDAATITGDPSASSGQVPQSAIDTGDASSQTQVETVANVNIDCVAGQVSTPEDPCDPPEIEAETDCPGGTEIVHDNLATASATATSSATTGDNIITGANDALIDTGDATAGGSIQNQINFNETNLTSSSNEEGQGEATGGDDSSLMVENENEVTATNSAEVLAGTGENQANENGGEATITTGNALAFANLLNLLNANIVSSNFELYLRQLLNQEENVDLNLLWKELGVNGGIEGLNLNDEGDLLFYLIENSNQADLENKVSVIASTGTNEANGNQGNALIETGDATALANVINFINLNLVGSQFFLGVINIFGEFLGDLILPRPEEFMNDSSLENAGGNDSSLKPVIFTNQNSVELDDSVVATAETGNNEESNNQGNNLIQTGDATSQTNAFSVLNTNIRLNNWFFLIINYLGSWTGRIFGWSAPEAVEDPAEDGPMVFQLGDNSQGGEEFSEAEELAAGGFPSGVVQNQNQASVKNEISVSASTGQNQASGNGGEARIVTGKATALANLFNLINLNILGSRWFLGVVNILGNWTGNVIFAYPDMAVTLSNGSGQAAAGGTTEYTLSYQNQGDDEAEEVVLELELPEGVHYLGDSSGLTAEITGQTCSWFLGSLGVGEGGVLTINVGIDPDFSFNPSTSLRAGEPQLSFWSKIIPQVHAAENGGEKEVVAVASIGTADPESDLSNNTASVTTVVYSPLPEAGDSNEEESDGGVDQSQPVLEISAWNNVGEYVYPGDTVTFEITIRNTGKGPSYDTYLTQALFNGLPEEDFGSARFEIGTLEPGEGGKLSFGLKLNGGHVLPVGPYHTEAQAFGYAPNGNEVASNQARTNFKIRLKDIDSLFEARAKDEEGVLGALENACSQKEDLLPYILLFLLSSLYLMEKSRRLKKAET